MMLRLIAAALACVVMPAAAGARPMQTRAAVVTCAERGCSDWHKNRDVPNITSGATRLSVSLSGVVATLAAKVLAIQAACPGTVILSTLRQTRRPGGSWSMHASGRAVDVRGDYACIYRQLSDWPAYSTDARRCRHIHISYGGDEGRFRHRYC